MVKNIQIQNYLEIKVKPKFDEQIKIENVDEIKKKETEVKSNLIEERKNN